MAKPSELWKRQHAHEQEVSKILIDLENMNRHGEIVGWVGKNAHIKMQKIGHSALDFNNCRCKDKE